ncbi:hypothetical protein Tco_1080181 [Tanacetum coccineum]|uniref:MAK10-like protein n=1 Tax=Tanacetum coccineum TaxID=301880 RepID=A0ABQ5HTZ7_9ASTR
MMQTDRGDGVASIERRHRDLSSDGVEDLTTASGRNRLKSDIEDSTWRQTLIILAAFRPSLGPQNPIVKDLDPCFNQDLLQKAPRHGINLWLQVQIFDDHVNPVTRRTIDQLVGGKLHDRNAEESWALLEDLAFYDNKRWNDPRDFTKPVKAISLPQYVPSTSDRRLIELEIKSAMLPTTLNIAWKISSKLLSEYAPDIYEAEDKWHTFNT